MFDKFLDKLGYDKSKIKALVNDFVLQGFEPSNTLFGMTYHARLIPPYKPQKTLILGYGMGTVADLIRRIWGDDCKIVCVDNDLSNRPYYEYKFIQEDALEVLKSFTRDGFVETFDYVVVDLFNGGEVVDYVFSEEFVGLLKKISSKGIGINIPMADIFKLKIYYENFDFLNQGIIFDSCVTFWTKKEEMN